MSARSNYLFSADLLKEEKSQVDLVLRPLHIDDFEKGNCTHLIF